MLVGKYVWLHCVCQYTVGLAIHCLLLGYVFVSIMKVSNIDKNKMIHSANSTKTMFYRVLEDMKKSIPDHLKGVQIYL